MSGGEDDEKQRTGREVRFFKKCQEERNFQSFSSDTIMPASHADCEAGKVSIKGVGMKYEGIFNLKARGCSDQQI